MAPIALHIQHVHIHSQHTGVDQPALIDLSALTGVNRQSNWPVAT